MAAKKSSEVAQELASLEASYNAEIAALDKMIVDGRDELVSGVRDWIKREVRSQVEAHPAEVVALGADKLRAFKQKVAELDAGVPALIERLTGEKGKYDHRLAPEDSNSATSSAEQYPKAVFRDAIAPLGAILNAFGLLPNGRYSTWEMSGQNSFRYTINHGYEPRNTQSFANYADRSWGARSLAQQVSAKRKELESAKARELYDSV